MNKTLSNALPLNRKLTAILAADFVGYSRLMHADEDRTLATLTRHRQILDDTIRAWRGRIAGTAGDSVLAEFASVVDAYRCAIAIQQELARANADLDPDSRMRLRIGVHTGDVVHLGGDIFGDDVNIACRVESLADADGICVTRAVRDHLRDHVDSSFEDLGEHTVKNIARPVRVFKALFDQDGEQQLPGPPTPGSGALTDPEPGPAPQDSAVELAFWQSVQASDDDGEYRLYLDRYPDGAFAHLARARLQNGGSRRPDDAVVEVAFWETVKESGRPEMVRAYLDKYPDGEFKPLAEIMLAGMADGS